MTRIEKKPLLCSYYVFVARLLEPTQEESRSGVYLASTAEARYLQQFFDPLHESTGIGISTSDDEVICGERSLQLLAESVLRATEDVKGKPDHWPVTIGHRLKSFDNEFGDAIVEQASRSRLLEFLEGVVQIVRHAQEASGYVYFCGGN